VITLLVAGALQREEHAYYWKVKNLTTSPFSFFRGRKQERYLRSAISGWF
jgi:hypothetical protein